MSNSTRHDEQCGSFSRYYEDFHPGEEILHRISKTITQGEHQLFTLLTMNHHPVHISVDFAEKSEFGKILVNGTYVFSLVVGITVPDLSYNATANLGYQSVEHCGPVFEGDTIYAKSEVLSKRESASRKDSGIVCFRTHGFVGDRKVITLSRCILIPLRNA